MMDEARCYELRRGDFFTVDLNSFMSNSVLWTKSFQILKFNNHKRKWWQFWKPKNRILVNLLYLGEEV